MITALLIALVVIGGSAGDVFITKAMKQLGAGIFLTVLMTIAIPTVYAQGPYQRPQQYNPYRRPPLSPLVY